MKKVLLGIFILLTVLHSYAQNDKQLKFAFLTDLHVAPNTPSEQNLQNIVKEINADNYDFVVVTGDLTNTGSDAELNTVHRVLSNLKTPLYIIPGNHETNWSESAGQTFIKLWGSDRFFFESGKYSFIGFSTGPYLKMGDGHVREEDLRWLDEMLKKNSTPGNTVISLSHYPLSDGLDNFFDVTAILKKHHTGLALCGHGHRLSFHNFDSIPGIMGRSVLLRGGNQPGYNFILLRNDSVLVYEKKLNEATEEAFKAFPLNNYSVLNGFRASKLPDYTENLSQDFQSPFQFQDSSSIFSGVLHVKTNMLVYGTSQGEGVALNPKNKKVLWRNKHAGSIYSTPVYGNGIVVFGTIDGYLIGVNARTGREKWKLNVGEPVIAEGTVEKDMLYIGTGSTSFYKINIKNGKIIWKNNSMDGQLQGKPVLTPDEVVFGAWDRHLYCIDKASGQLKWKWNNGSPQKLYSPGNVVPAVANGKVFIVAPDRYMTAIDLKTGNTVWRTNAHTVRESMAISKDGRTVYAKLMNDTIIAVSAEGNVFNLLWKVDAGFGYEHNPCPLLETNGIIYAGTKNGQIVAIDANTRKMIWKHKAGNSSVNKIVADDDGNIWISLIEGKILQYRNFKTGLTKLRKS